MLIGNDSAEQAAGASRIWLVTVDRADLKPGYPPPQLADLASQWSRQGRLQVNLYAASPQQIVPAP